MRRAAAMLALVACVLFLPALGARDLWNPNEPIYGLAVREMAESGSWLAPTVNGREFAEKPILYFWMARIAALCVGLDEGSLRLPSVLAAIAIVLGAYALAAPYGGRERALLAGAMTATTVAVFWGARTIQMDILLAATTLWAILPVARVADHGWPAARGFALSGLAAGLGFLAKGPVGWVLPAIALACYLVSTGRMSILRSRHALTAAAIAIAVAAPWPIALAAAGRGEFLREMLFRQNVERFTNAWDHVQPWWYYLKYVWIDMAPWSWLLPAAVALPERSPQERGLDRLSWIILAGTIAFFSLSQSKRSAYILPVAPAVAILAAGVLDRLRAGRLGTSRGRFSRAVLSTIGAVLAAGAGIAAARVPAHWPELRVAALVLGGIVGIAGVAILAAALAPRRDRFLPPVAIAAVGAAFLAIAVVGLPQANRVKSARGFCDEVRARSGAGAEIVGWGLWRWRAEYPYYLGRSVPLFDDADALRDLWGSRSALFVIAENEGIEKLGALLDGATPVIDRRIGGRRVALFGPADQRTDWQRGQ